MAIGVREECSRACSSNAAIGGRAATLGASSGRDQVIGSGMMKMMRPPGISRHEIQRLLHERVNNASPVLHGHLNPFGPRYERPEIRPAFRGQLPVVGYSGLGLVDLIEDVDRVPRRLRTWVEGVGKLGTLGHVVGEQRQLARPGVSCFHPRSVAAEEPIAFSDLVWGNRENCIQLYLPLISHHVLRSPVETTGILRGVAGFVKPRLAAGCVPPTAAIPGKKGGT